MGKKKLIWWERHADRGGAGEARRRGAPEGSGGRRPDAYYGPVILGTADDGPADPDGVAGGVG